MRRTLIGSITFLFLFLADRFHLMSEGLQPSLPSSLSPPPQERADDGQQHQCAGLRDDLLDGEIIYVEPGLPGGEEHITLGQPRIRPAIHGRVDTDPSAVERWTADQRDARNMDSIGMPLDRKRVTIFEVATRREIIEERGGQV